MSQSPIRLVKRYLCVKKLTVNDGFTSKSIKLPRAEARFFMGDLRNRQAIPLVLLDEEGNCWELMCTCSGAQYALSRIGAFCEAHSARPGCYFIFYADHEHIVRLAVRQQLPDDVQAAIAAARAAAMAVRSCQRATQPPHAPEQTPTAYESSNSTASLPANPTSQPVLDDPVALDEMPLACPELHTAAISNTSPLPVVKQRISVEPLIKSMPLQDRSNLPAGAPLSGVATNGPKPKPIGIRNGFSAAAVSGPTASMYTAQGSAAADKENDASVLAAPAPTAASRTQLNLSAFTVVSTGGLQAPTTASSPALLQQQQQQPAPRPAPSPPPPPAPPPPPPPSSLLSRSPPALPAPSPATRLRLRFEARLRGQAGKLHPLSVRTGPESPPPSPPGYCAAVNEWHVAALPSVYPPPGAAPPFLGGGVSSSLLPAGWALTTAWGHPAPGFHPDCSASTDMFQRQEEPPGLHGSTVCNGVAAPGIQLYVGGPGSAPRRQLHSKQQLHAAEQDVDAAPAVLAAAQQPGQPCEDWRQRLQCDELLDWEVGRRAAHANSAHASAALNSPGLPTFWQFAGPMHPAHPQPPPPPQSPLPCSPTLPSGPVALNRVHMGLLRQLHLLPAGQNGMAPNSALSCDGGDGGVLVQLPPGAPSDASNLHPQQPQRLLQSLRHEGTLLSLAATHSALRQLLSVSIAAWDFAAMSSAAGRWSPGVPAPQPGCTAACCGAVRAVPPSHAPPLADVVDSAAPAQRRTHHVFFSTAAQASSGACTDVDMDRPEVGQQQQGNAYAGGARGWKRDTLADAPDSKRRRSGPQLPEQPSLLARKALTTRDLLTDRVALCVAPSACEAMARLLRGGEAARGAAESLHCAVSSSGSWLANAVSTTPMQEELNPKQRQPLQHKQQQFFPAAEPRDLPLSVPVDVLVETGAHYEGLLQMLQGPGTEWELQGLLPYLIRRQAGVGDMLSLGLVEVYTNPLAGGGSSCSCLQLVAELHKSNRAIP